jgi:hypothetical protein
MHVELSTSRKERARHRHDLHTLTYVVLDQANGGIVRNINHEGIAVQAVAAVRAGQHLRLRFELPHPRLRIETRGEVVWSSPTGQCGIRFVDLPPRMRRRVDEWIFGNLLESVAPHVTRAAARNGARTAGRFPGSGAIADPLPGAPVEDDGFALSPAPVKVIELKARPKAEQSRPQPVAPEVPELDFSLSCLPQGDAARDNRLLNAALSNQVNPAAASASVAANTRGAELDWLSQPLSARGIAWSINALAVLAALLICALVFLSVTGESPRWPVAMVAGAAVFVAGFYWGFFKLIGGASPGVRLARLAGYDDGDREDEFDRSIEVET